MSKLTRVAVGAIAILVGVAAVAGSAESADDGTSLALDWNAPTLGEPSYLLADELGVVSFADDGRVFALGNDGSEEWSADTGEGKVVLFHVRPSMGSGLVVAPADEREAVALDRKTGVERWRVPLAGVTSSGVGTAGGAPFAAIVNRAGALVVLDGSSGLPRWSAQLPDFDENSLAGLWFAADRLVVQWTPTARGTRLAVFDVSSGAIVWSRAMLAASSPSIVDDAVLFAEMLELDGKRVRVQVQSVSIASGQPQWSTEFRTRSLYFTSAASAARADDFAIVDLAGEVRLFDTVDGTMRWKHATRRKQYEADLRIAGDVVAMSTYGTGLVALSTADGETVETRPVGGVQLGVTIEATAAVGDRLYLLVSDNGPVRDEAEVWSFRASR